MVPRRTLSEKRGQFPVVWAQSQFASNLSERKTEHNPKAHRGDFRCVRCVGGGREQEKGLVHIWHRGSVNALQTTKTLRTSQEAVKRHVRYGAKLLVYGASYWCWSTGECQCLQLFHMFATWSRARSTANRQHYRAGHTYISEWCTVLLPGFSHGSSLGGLVATSGRERDESQLKKKQYACWCRQPRCFKM